MIPALATGFPKQFSGGKLPPKSAIREIRINQNPYSAQYDTLGFGRIEIFTKPGTDKLHGEYWMQGNDSPWNAPNPFVTSQPPYHSYLFDGDLNGPLSKTASVFAGIFGQNAVNDAIINAVVLDAANNPVPLTQAVSSTSSTLNVSPRFDLQWGKVQTLSLRYQLERNTSANAGVGQFELASQGYSSANTEQVLQFSDAQAYGAKLLNETRFQYIRDRNSQTPQTNAPTLVHRGGDLGDCCGSTAARLCRERLRPDDRERGRPALEAGCDVEGGSEGRGVTEMPSPSLTSRPLAITGTPSFAASRPATSRKSDRHAEEHEIGFVLLDEGRERIGCRAADEHLAPDGIGPRIQGRGTVRPELGRRVGCVRCKGHGLDRPGQRSRHGQQLECDWRGLTARDLREHPDLSQRHGQITFFSARKSAMRL